MLLSIAYCPPVEYFALLAKYSVVSIDACEHYCKQSWRNRCRILTANGPEDLRVPVVHTPDLFHTPVSEVLVDYSTPWVRQTEYALESAYFSTPYYEYYRDDLNAILDSQPLTLWDLDLQTTGFVCQKMGLTPEILSTTAYVADAEEDYRTRIHPKKPSTYEAKPYHQLFGDRYGFVPGLSGLDLLFNMGPESILYL